MMLFTKGLVHGESKKKLWRASQLNFVDQLQNLHGDPFATQQSKLQLKRPAKVIQYSSNVKQQTRNKHDPEALFYNSTQCLEAWQHSHTAR